MIIEWLVTIAANVVGWISDNLLTWDGAQPRAIWSEMEGMVAQVGSMGVWIDWASIATAVGLAVTVWLACLAIKAVRALIAHIPQIGGAG